MSKITISVALLCVLMASCSQRQTPSSSIETPSSAVTSTVTSTSAIAQELPATETDTPIPLASDTPALTSTPEIVVIQDDFSSKSTIWGDCENCTWKNGALYYGPFRPVGSGYDQVFYMICEACGEHMYYRVAADVTYVEGYGGDRTFGLLAGLFSDDFLGAGTVSTYQVAMYETFDFNTNSFGGTGWDWFAAVKPGDAINRIEVTIRPSLETGKADIYLNINGTNVIVLFGQDIQPSKVGLYLGWHSVGAMYDNFEYEVLEMEN